jgi:hypothetical protein
MLTANLREGGNQNESNHHPHDCGAIGRTLRQRRNGEGNHGHQRRGHSPRYPPRATRSRAEATPTRSMAGAAPTSFTVSAATTRSSAAKAGITYTVAMATTSSARAMASTIASTVVLVSIGLRLRTPKTELCQTARGFVRSSREGRRASLASPEQRPLPRCPYCP